MSHFNKTQIALIVSSAVLFSGCASVSDPSGKADKQELSLEQSFLESSTTIQTDQKVSLEGDEAITSEFIRLKNLSENEKSLKLEVDLSNKFGDEKEFQVSVNELPLNDFLHYVLGELLNTSYLIEPKVKKNSTPVTLELKEPVSGKKLFQLVQQVLDQNNISIAFNNDILFIHQTQKQGGLDNKAFGFGRAEEDVPEVSGQVIQLVPLRYGASAGLRGTISNLVNAKITLDAKQGLLTIEGKREQIVRALSLVNLLDSQAIYNKAMALLSFQYIDSQTFIDKVNQLLAEEGITDKSRPGTPTISYIPIEHLGKVVVFANADEIIDKVEYWTKQLDKPAKGSEQTFYTYHPRFARASDLGQSLAPLIASNKSFSGTTQTSSNNFGSVTNDVSNSRDTTPGVSRTIDGEDMRLVVDQRSNSLIFYSTGKRYQELQPIIRKLDVMPKQVMLEVVIAEVTLSDSFAKGVEYALTNGPSGSRTENFSFNSESGFSYSVVGLDGSINFNLNQTNGLVNVLSRPTLLVRDGVSATISVGDDIPTVGSTTSDPDGDRQTTSIQYRSTGIDLAVTPTVNAQGTVIMTIEQNISNVAADGLSINDSPSIFERKVSTEVVAGDGQTVMLGGLISENKSNNANAIPGLGDLPLLGHLFRSDSESNSKTELVILVTPKIVHSLNDWQRIQNSFIKGLENIRFSE